MEDGAIGDTPYPFDGEAPEDGEMDCVVEKPKFEIFNPSPSGEGQGVGPARSGSMPERAATHPATTPDPSSKEEGLKGRVYINKSQYFEHVPELAWNFHIGGYQPAQKWLKDRKGQKLSWDDIRHYQKIIKILNETGRIMGEIKLPLDG